MAPPRRGGRSRSLAPPELRGALGSLLRTTLAQASAVRDALERGAREGRARLDDALSERKRAEALADLGEIVLDLVRRGRLEDLADIPEIADAIAAVEDIDARRDERDRGDEPGRDWIQPETRARFDRDRPRTARRAAPERDADDGTVSSASWRPPRPARPMARVWRPPVDDAEAEPEPPPAKPARQGGIVFPAAADDDSVGDEDDLASYMHPDDVPPRK